ncbi:Iron import ATP-binding/permease protein IrtA [Actinomyces bovis]|uniref:Iron import ATP-binding/permease protein IrtA n=1 Tax=Actinomyces bovis TaxID=1658 RepID=A0ABY1VRB5_9ACTO|nr:Iron import ATP-binding/permease protein IrtA [Actinomyces bovis]VEG56553.1 Iron import ATP-binding/permease protein IrtA [Actinomyces israelii]
MFEALDKINYGLTILLVAHRFTTISHADHIVVLDGGRVVGSGTHDSLLSSCKFYADMFRAQRDYR